MSNLLDILSVLILFSALIMTANKRIGSYIRTLRIQSFLIAVAAGMLGVTAIREEGRYDLFILFAVIVILKVVLIPNFLLRMYAKSTKRTGKDFIFNIPILVLVSGGLVVFTYFTLNTVDGLNDVGLGLQVINSISMILIGLFFMISRKRAIGQIIGFLELENGLYVTAMFCTHGMPLIVDLGIMVDLLTAVMIMGVMVFRINQTYESINLKNLNRLKG